MGNIKISHLRISSLKMVLIISVLVILALMLFLLWDGSQNPKQRGEMPPSAQERLEHYREYARYPHRERPLLDNHLDEIEPYMPQGGDIVFSEEPESRRVARRLNCRLAPTRRISVGMDPFNVHFSCKGEEGDSISGIEVNDVDLYQGQIAGDDATPADGSVNIISPKNGNYRFEVKPGLQDEGWMSMKVHFSYAGNDFLITTNWESSPKSPAEFLIDEIKEEVEEGHLLVTIPIEVHRPGVYAIHANLQQSAPPNEYIAKTGGTGELKEKGRQEIRLRFFGKILHDRDIDGPYTIRMLRGHRKTGANPQSRETLELMIESGESPYVDYDTEAMRTYINPVDSHELGTPHVASDFSAKEWESPSKERRIRMLERER